MPGARREPWRGIRVAGEGRVAGSRAVDVAHLAEEDGTEWGVGWEWGGEEESELTM